MGEALDKVLNAADRIDRVHKYFESIGSTSEQAATAAAAHADKFVWNGATLEFQGKPVADPDNGVREWFTSNHLDFLLPPKGAAERPDVDADTLASAKSGNMTAYSRIVRSHGKDTADKLIAEKPGDTAADTTAKEKPARKASDPKNPFVGFRDAAGKVDPVKAATVAALIKSAGIAHVKALSEQAGVTLGGYPLRKAG